MPNATALRKSTSESRLSTGSVINARDYPHPMHFAGVNNAPREIEQSKANRAAAPLREFVHTWKVVARPGPGNVGGALIAPKQKESSLLVEEGEMNPSDRKDQGLLTNSPRSNDQKSRTTAHRLFRKCPPT
jgi:hypothetical protein